MTTRAEAMDAEDFARKQRTGLLRLLRSDPTKGDPDTLTMVLAASKRDPLKFDAILAHHKVAALFRAGALFFAQQRSHLCNRF